MFGLCISLFYLHKLFDPLTQALFPNEADPEPTGENSVL